MGRKLTLTAEDQAVLNVNHEILHSLGNLQMTLANLQGIKTGTLRVAAVTAAAWSRTPIASDSKTKEETFFYATTSSRGPNPPRNRRETADTCLKKAPLYTLV